MAPPEVRAMEIEELETTTGGRLRAKLAIAVAVLALLGVSVAVLTPPKRSPPSGSSVLTSGRGSSGPTDFTFEQFVQKYGRTYKLGSEEYTRRAAIFQQSLAEIEAINAKPENQFWRAGPTHFMDWTVEERSSMKGYNKRAKRASLKAMSKDMDESYGPPDDWTPPESGGMATDDPRGPAIRNQGGCGSCWAFASASVAEAYILKGDTDEQYVPEDVKLSTQVLVDCVENPHNCGGQGGCLGSTQDLAYNFTYFHGIPLEKEVPYTEEDGECVEPHMQGLYPASPLARVAGWRDLPSNNDQRHLMYELLNGPVTVGVAADSWWYVYNGGLFDCHGATGIDHAVMAKGFGKQDYPFPMESKLYWLIQNSWGADWGEEGHIRLERAPDESTVVGVDQDTSIGMACDGDDETAEVRGACGILYAPVVPFGVTLSDVSASVAMV